MRLSSLLPMLLLLVGPLTAQQNCNISGLSATVVQFNPDSCQFFVVLDFDHVGTTNQFTVKGNGTNYGTFDYGQIPLTLGPLSANINGPTVLEFIVQDAVFLDCNADVTIDVPTCTGTSFCDISDLKVELGACNPLNLTYELTVDFNVSSAINTLFEVYTSNGQSLGVFPLTALPLTIPNFPWGGGPVDNIKVCIANHPNCCESLAFDAPDCFTPGCGLFNLQVTPGTCINDSTYKAVVKFGFLNVISLNTEFKLFLDGVLQGTFTVGQLPLATTFQTNGNPHPVVKICVELINGSICCLEEDFTAPDCFIPCAIKDLKIETDSCASDSTFGITLNFTVVDTTAVDSFGLWGNGQLIGQFGMDQLPLHIDDFEWNGLIFNQIRVCTGNLPACCKELQFLAPDCLPFDSCSVTHIATHTGVCTGDSTYNLTLNFNANNPGNGTFIVWANGALLDTFDLTDVPLFIPDFPWNGGANDLVTVCIGQTTTPGTNLPSCCKTNEFQVPDCLGSCEITDLHIEVGDCDTINNTYPLTINFNVIHPGNDLFDVYSNGQLIGTFPLNQLPVTIPDYPNSGALVDVLKVCINDHPNCCAVEEFNTPNCDAPPCQIFDLVIDPGACTPNNVYALTIDFEFTSPGNGSFDVYANGQLFGTFPLNLLPMTIPNFPASGNLFDEIKICINDHPGCCLAKEFPSPCSNVGCDIFDLVIEAGPCDSTDNTYHVIIDFEVANPGSDSFDVYANGQLFGSFMLSQLPLTIPNFPASGNPIDVIKICINDHPNCCVTKELHSPCSNGQLCHIFDLVYDAGACDTSDNTYPLLINFQVTNPGNDEFDVYANGQLFGTYMLSQLPLTIPNFPASGNPIDVIKICINDHPNCCVTKEIQSPCSNGQPCNIFDFHAVVGDCTPLGTFSVTLDFEYSNPGNDLFDVWINGQQFGTFPLNQLPLTIQDFPANNNAVVQVVKVCINDQPDCCAILEFQAPNCDNCEIHDLEVEVGNCNADSVTYNIWVDFIPVNTNATLFVLFANGVNLGTFNINQLPLHIPDFPWDGQGPNDVLKVCMVSSNTQIFCCETIEFPIPDCLHGGGICDINDLHVDAGICTSDSTYKLTINFNVVNPIGNTFGVWANGQFFGMFGLGQLPLTIQNFPWSGNAKDVVKVCLGNNTGTSACCAEVEFFAPDCLTNDDCKIFDMIVDTGDCTGDSTYNLLLNFNVQNPLSNLFGVWSNGVLLGNFTLGQLPLQLQDINWDGGTHDAIKVCLLDTTGSYGCCKTIEYQVPGCLGGGNCEIFGLVVDPGDCTGDSTYNLFINFQFVNPPSAVFGVWANGVFMGSFNTNQLPLNFPNFPWNGGTKDEVKVCFLNAGNPSCCRALEFDVPDCLTGGNDCHIWDVHAVRTPCLCGQFFVALTFNHANGTSAGFDLVGNGNNYGNYPYNTQQPIILGPFPGDGSTVYEFGVVDHELGNCEDGFVLGVVTCMSPVSEPGSSSSLVISPNPASSWINVTAMLENGTQIGQATANVYHADGRLIMNQIIGNAANFQLDVSNIPAGVYRLSIQGDSGRLEGSFIKQ